MTTFFATEEQQSSLPKPSGQGVEQAFAGGVPETPRQAEMDVSVVLGSLNRLSLLKLAIASVRQNGFSGKMEIVVVDGGSTDGTLPWLARQRDILTIVQPNYKITNSIGSSVLAHSWGNFMNIGFRACRGKWILMISDDLFLTQGCIRKSFEMLERPELQGQPVGGGALFFRDYPRELKYHVNLLPGELVLINHGFFLRTALEEIQYIDEHTFNFYYADSDLCMRLGKAGYKIVPLDGCLANHLAHMPDHRVLFGKPKPKGTGDLATFEQRWGKLVMPVSRTYSDCLPPDQSHRKLWRLAPIQCALSATTRRFSRLKRVL